MFTNRRGQKNEEQSIRLAERKKTRYRVGRRAQDIFFSLLAVIVLSPLFLFTALIIYIDDPDAGPIFCQIRCGRNGRLFRMYKFRSMCADAEAKLPDMLAQNEMDGPAFKIKNDPRVTRVGRILRKTCLDELPQLWNVLKGDMSLVGPRPPLPREVEQYTELQMQRMFVTPGLTCYWQIQPNRNEIGFDKWLELDLKYIRERSFLVDWKIILRTVKTVLLRHGV
jgi:lipopolysaccharide/colanic/teichoic acid biosynthesis glycosyltransferase